MLKTAFETYRAYQFAQDSDWAAFLVDFFKATLRKVRRSDRDFSLLADGELANGGIVGERHFTPPDMLANDLQKSSSDTGATDHEVWSTVKNYPRRNYLSPTDCGRRIEEDVYLKAGSGKFAEGEPPVSYLGWNISGLVADVVRIVPEKTSENGNGDGGAVKGAVAAGADASQTATARVAGDQPGAGPPVA